METIAATLVYMVMVIYLVEAAAMIRAAFRPEPVEDDGDPGCPCEACKAGRRRAATGV